MEPADELELSDYLAILRRRWVWVLAPLVVVVVAAVALTVSQEPTYRATASVLLGSSAAEDAVARANTNPALLSRELSNEISYATSDEIEASVEQALGELPDIDVQADTEADLLRFSADARTPERAAEIANVWAQTYVNQKQADALASITAASDQLGQRLTTLRERRQELRAPLDDLRDQLALLPLDDSGDVADPVTQARIEVQIAQLEADLEAELALISSQEAAVTQTIATLELQGQLAEAGSARLVNRAVPPEQPSNAPLSRNVALAVVVGLILGVAAALLRENLDRALKDPEDVQRLVGLAVLTAVPKQSGGRRRAGEGDLGLATLRQPDSSLADSYHKVRTALQFAAVSRPVRSVLVTSANQGEGKTVSAANLAWAMASVVERVVLVDGDFRRPRLHEVYGVGNDAGLTDHVLSGASLAELAIRVRAPEGQMTVLRTGPLPPNPSDFVASNAFSTTLAELTDDEGGLVVIDGPPVLPVSDALSLARLVDVVILVAYAGRTTSDELQRAHQALEQVGAYVLGVIVTGVAGAAGYYKYGYYSPDADASRYQAQEATISVPTSSRQRRGEPLDHGGIHADEASNGPGERSARRLSGRRG